MARTILVYSFHNQAPYYFPDEKKPGLTEYFVKLLNEESKKNKLPFEFEHHLIPRKRVSSIVKSGGEIILLHGNPVFFGMKKTDFFWSPPYMKDTISVISSQLNPYEFEGPDSLKMDCMVTIRGYIYPYLDEAIRKKMLARYDVETSESTLGMVQKQRCRAGAIAQIHLHYFKKSDALKMDSIHISKQGLGQFDRQILSLSPDKRLNDFLGHFARDLKTHPRWKKVLQDFGIPTE
jgi:hypothetical protein